MNREKIVESHISDLKVGYELAELSKNEFLQKYIKDQLDNVKANYELSFFTDLDLALAYSVDLVLFIKTSNIIGDIDNKDYFMNRLNELSNFYPNIRETDEVKEII